MRVVQLITQARGGPVDHAREVAVELARQGHDSHLLAPPGVHLDGLAGAGVVPHVAAMTSKTDLTGARAVARVLDGLAPDLVHLQDRRAGMVGRLWSHRSGVPTVYTLHGVPDSLAPLVPGNLGFTAPRRRDRWGNLTGERLLARTPRSLVVAPCAALARYAAGPLQVPPARVRCVPNGVTDHWFTGPGPTRRPGHEVLDRPVQAVWLGVMEPVKQLPELVRAAAEVPGLRLLLVGDGPARAQVAATCTLLGVEDRVDLVGFRPDPCELLAGAEIFVLPSAAEAAPMALLQAMALGLAVVATRVGGVPEIVRDGVDGLLVPAGDQDRLAAALHRLGRDPDLRRRLGGSARRRVRDDFTVERCTRQLLTVYREVAR